MITGDNALTAFAIAKECGILEPNTPDEAMDKYVISGTKFNEMTGGTREIYEGMEGMELLDEYSIKEWDDSKLEQHKKSAQAHMKLGQH